MGVGGWQGMGTHKRCPYGRGTAGLPRVEAVHGAFDAVGDGPVDGVGG